MANLNQSFQHVISTLSSALQVIVERIQTKKDGDILTVSAMVEDLAQSTGLNKQLLQQAASAVINASDDFHISKGRYGGVQAGPRPEPKPVKVSEKKKLEAELASLKAQIEQLNTVNSDSDTESQDAE